VYAVFAVILAALATCSVVSYRLSGSRPAGQPAARQQLRGFLYVGAVALVALAVAVVVAGLLGDRTARAEGLAMFGLFTYTLYLLAALLLARRVSRR
jgi:hypothetical protein